MARAHEVFRPALEEAGIEVVAPSISGQFLVGDALVEALAGCDGVVAGDDRFTADVLERLPGLRAIAKWGIGVDSIDPKVPPFVIVKVPPSISSSVIFPAFAFIA